jgi:protein TonB
MPPIPPAAAYAVSVALHLLLLLGLTHWQPSAVALVSPGDPTATMEMTLIEAQAPEPGRVAENAESAESANVTQAAEPQPTPSPAPLQAERVESTPTPETEATHALAPAPVPKSAPFHPARSERPAHPAYPGMGGAEGLVQARPQYRANPPPPYPPDARRKRQEGVVLMMVQVTAAGQAGEVKVQRSSGYESLDAAAVKAVRRWRFEPARRWGQPEESRVEVPVRFVLRE